MSCLRCSKKPPICGVQPFQNALDIGIPEIPAVDSFTLFIGDVSASLRERFGDGAIRFQQMVLKPAGDIEGWEALGWITFDRAD